MTAPVRLAQRTPSSTLSPPFSVDSSLLSSYAKGQDIMSTVYATEPPPSGRVIIETTHGPLEIQLWCKECPETTRLFVQLCRDRYYDDAIFHRIVPKFLIQTGAVRNKPTAGTQSGEDLTATLQEALEKEASMLRQPPSSTAYANYRRAVHADRALERRRYEVHSRLRFSHRGIVAMALTVQEDGSGDNDNDNDNKNVEWMQPQFFLTLDEAPFLDGKHVVFGSCVGPTYFNAVRISQVDVDETNNAPNEWREAPRIVRVKILEVPSPLESQLVHVASVPWKQKDDDAQSATAESQKTKKKKRKGRLDVNVLSFGDEVTSEEVVMAAPLPQRASNQVDEIVVATAADDDDDLDHGHDRTFRRAQQRDDKAASNGVVSNGDAESDARNSTQVHVGASSSTLHHADRDNFDHRHQAPSDSGPGERNHGRETGKSTSQIPDASVGGGAIDRSNEDGPSAPPVAQRSTGSLVEARKAQFAAQRMAAAARAKQQHPNGTTSDKRQREDDTMAKLAAFQSNLKRTAATTATASAQRAAAHDRGGLASRMAKRSREESHASRRDAVGADVPTYHGQVLEDDEDDEDDNVEPEGEGKVRNDWMQTQFRCRRSAADGDALVGGDGRHADDYQVLDDRDRRHRPRDDGAERKHRHSHTKKDHHDPSHRRSADDRPRDHRLHNQHGGHR